MQCVSNGEDLKFLLQSKQCHGKLAKSSVGMYMRANNPNQNRKPCNLSLCFSSSPLQLHFSQMISSFPLCASRHRWRSPLLLTQVLAMTKTATFLRLSCLMKSYLQTLPRQRTSLTCPKGLICRHPLAGSSSSSRGCTNAPSVTNASSTTLSSSNTRESTAGCSLTTALSVAGLSEQPLSWLATDSGNAKMLRTCALNVATVFQPRWTNSDTTARNVAAATTVDSAARLFRSPAA